MELKQFNTAYSFVAMAVFAVMASCSPNPQSPGVEYMPDMYRSPSLEAYSINTNYSDSMEARLPVEGTIPRGYVPYGIPNTNEGYELAGNVLRNPFPSDEMVLEQGKVIYTKYCQHCHGQTGAGDGLTVTAGGHPPPPAYNSATLQTLSEGKMFHTITYGKNLMGSHASQLNVDERWMVIRYVQTLQNPGGTATAPADSNATDSLIQTKK